MWMSDRAGMSNVEIVERKMEVLPERYYIILLNEIPKFWIEKKIIKTCCIKLTLKWVLIERWY